jgi:O-antigen/teichoic acid export membrane protein
MLSGVITTIVNIIITGVSYPLYLHYLGYKKYGIWLILSTVLTFAQLGNLGINPAISKIVAEEYSHKNFKAIQEYVTIAISILLGSGILCLFIILIFKPYIVGAFKLSFEDAELVLWLLPYISLLSVYVFIVEACNSILSGLGRMDLANSAQVTGRLSLLGISSLLLFAGYDIVSLLVASALSYMVINIQTIIHIRKIMGINIIKFVKFNPYYVKRLWEIARVVLAGSVIVMFFDPFNKLMLSRYAGVSTIPVYDLAFRGTMQIRGVIESGLRAIMPEVSRLAAKIDDHSVTRIKQINSKAIKTIALSIIVVFMPVYLFCTELLKVWLGKNFVANLPFSFRIALLSVVVSLVSVPSYYTLMGLGKVRHILISHILLSSINIIIVITIAFIKPLALADSIYFAILAGQSISTIYLIYVQRKELC